MKMIFNHLSQPFPKQHILDSSNLKEFADGNFGFAENGRKFSKTTENTVGKGEIACYEQFLLFPWCFPKTCPADTSKPGLVWERVNNLFCVLTILRHKIALLPATFDLLFTSASEDMF